MKIDRTKEGERRATKTTGREFELENIFRTTTLVPDTPTEAGLNLTDKPYR